MRLSAIACWFARAVFATSTIGEQDALVQLRLLEEAMEDRFALMEIQVGSLNGGCQFVFFS